MTRLLAALVLLGTIASDPVPAVRLDAVVTDAAGRAIVDLRPADFELRENGVVRPLEAVELRASRQGSRAFAIFLDEYHVAAGPPTERVRSAMARFLAAHVRPGDVAAVIRPLDRVSALSFTADVEALTRAVESFAGRKGDYAPTTAFEREYIGRAPATVAAARRQIVASALREIALRLGERTAERAVVVLASEGFSRTPPPDQRQVRVPDLQALVRAASRFHLAIYAFNPADAAPRSSDSATLEWLANQTGGRAALEGATLDAALERMAADLDAYYALTYRPSAADGRFHPVEVTAKRRNAIVRTRPGYWSPLAIELRASLEMPTAPTARRGLRRSTSIEAWTGVWRGEDGGMRMTVTWEARSATPARAVRLVARTEAGATLFEGELAPAGAASATVRDAATFVAPPGRVELDLAVVDVAGTVLDTDTRDVSVPDPGKRAQGPVLFTPQVIRARTAPEFRAVVANPQPAPSPSRVFGRGDRLLLRVPAWDPSGAAVAVAAAITNEKGGVMRALDRAAVPPTTDATFDLPLAWLAPGNYALVFSAKSEHGEATQTVRFSVR